MINPDSTSNASADRLSVGDIVTATIVDPQRFGLFVQINGAYEGFIDVLDISSDGSPIDWDTLPQAGSMVEAVVISIEENGTYRLSLKNSFKDLKERWLEYKRRVDMETVLTGRIFWCRKGEVLVYIGKPFRARLTNPRFDAHDWNNEDRMIRCRIVGFDDRLLEILVEEE